MWPYAPAIIDRSPRRSYVVTTYYRVVQRIARQKSTATRYIQGSYQLIQIRQKCLRIGCVISCCKLQRSITQRNLSFDFFDISIVNTNRQSCLPLSVAKSDIRFFAAKMTTLLDPRGLWADMFDVSFLSYPSLGQKTEYGSHTRSHTSFFLPPSS